MRLKALGVLLLLTLATTLGACGGSQPEGGGEASPSPSPTESPSP